MKQKIRILEIYGLWLADLFSIWLSFMAATYIRFHNFKDMGDKNIHFLVLWVFLLFCTVYSFFLEWNGDFLKRGRYRELLAILKFNIFMMLITQTIMYFLKWADVFSRWVMIYFAVINILLMWFLHVAIRQIVKAYYKTDSSKIKVLVITHQEFKEDVYRTLKANLDIFFHIVEVVCTEEMPEDFIEQKTKEPMDEVFIYTPRLSQRAVQDLVNSFDEMGVVCHYCVELLGTDRHRSKEENFGSYSVISYNHFQSGYKRLLVKRFVDIIGALVGLLITGLFLPFVALAIKLDSKGPVFFKQTRIGLNGRRFQIYKFRSMYLDAEERKKELMSQNEMQGLMFKMEDDPRITKVGKFIRKTSIDELPQFLNVLKGDMSLVGTRPPTEDEFVKYNQHYRRRISMTPGLTGLWQVSGRSEIEDFDDVVKLDLKYIDSWSLTLDLKILLKTVLVVLGRKGSK